MRKKYNKQRSFGYDKDGKRIIKWFHADSMRDLERQVENYRLQLKFTPNVTNIRFESYAKQWVAAYKGNRSKQTQDMYKWAIRKCEPIFDIPLTKITKTHCQKVISMCWETPTTAKNVANTLRQIFNTAIADGVILRNPALNLDLPKKYKQPFHLLTERELDALNKAELNEQDRMFVTILRTFGLRPGEALALTKQDFDFKTKTLHITKALELANDNKTQVKSTKTGVSREIPIPSALLPVLASYFALTKGFLLFTNKNATYHTKSSYKRLCERVMKAWNIALGGDSNFNMLSSVTMYSFRHLRASELMYLTQGDHPTLSILKASELMGHSVNVFLNTYSHVIEKNEQLDKIYDGVTDMLQVTQM